MRDKFLGQLYNVEVAFRNQARHDRVLEAELRSCYSVIGQIAELTEALNQKQRDYSVLIRLVQLVYEAVRTGSPDWIKVYHRMDQYKKWFEAQYKQLDATLSQLLSTTEN